jgi:hypothetical protein
MIVSCQGIVEKPSIEAENHHLPNDQHSRAYQEGFYSFQQQQYETAIEAFTFAQASVHPGLRRQATYGKACAQLALAESTKAWSKALALWEAWRTENVEPWQPEDARMLGPALMQLGTECIYNDVLHNRYQKQVSILENNLRLAQDKEIKLNQHIQDLQRQMIALKKRLKSLEAIDQEMQEKKKKLQTQ